MAVVSGPGSGGNPPPGGGTQPASGRTELTDEPANMVGAKGLGAPVTIPTAGAIANAIDDVVAEATPMSKNAYKIPLFKGLMTQEPRRIGHGG